MSDTSLLGTSIARPQIAKRLIEITKPTGADSINHGETGKGNNPIRFKLGAYTQAKVHGFVRVKFYKGSVSMVARDSVNALPDPTFATFDNDSSAYNHVDAGSFIKLNAMRMRGAARKIGL